MNFINEEKLVSSKFVVERVRRCDPFIPSVYRTSETAPEMRDIKRSGSVRFSSAVGIKVMFPWLAFVHLDERGDISWVVVRDDDYSFEIELADDVEWDDAFARDAATFDLSLELALSLSDWEAEVEMSLSGDKGEVLDMSCSGSLQRIVIDTGCEGSLIFIGEVLGELESDDPRRLGGVDRTLVRVYRTKCERFVCEHIEYKAGQEKPVEVFAGAGRPYGEPEYFPGSHLWDELWTMLYRESLIA